MCSATTSMNAQDSSQYCVHNHGHVIIMEMHSRARGALCLAFVNQVTQALHEVRGDVTIKFLSYLSQDSGLV